METIERAINLLNAVVSTMEGIAIVGIENQSRFVGCAGAVQNVSHMLTEYVQHGNPDSAVKEDDHG